MTYREVPNSIDAECAEKHDRLLSMMSDQHLDAVIVSRHENIAWLTAGLVEVRVGFLRETGPASLLITKDRQAFYITTSNEALRLAEEEIKRSKKYVRMRVVSYLAIAVD